MKKRFFSLSVAVLLITTGVTFAGCRGEQSSTLPYISSMDEVYYATGYISTESDTVEATTAATTESPTGATNPNANEISENTTYPTAVSQKNSSSSSKSNSSSWTSSSASSAKALTLSSNSVSIKVGESKTITVTINTDKTGTGSYSAETINGNASVSCSGENITITGKKAGNSTVIVKSGDQKASCNIIITNSQTSQQISDESNITDDTKVEYKKLCTDYYQAKITSYINTDFYDNGNGASYSSSLKKDSSDANVIEIKYSTLKDKKTSVNSLVDELCNQFEEEMKKSDNSEDFDIKNYKINCYSEKQSSGEYTIYFCYIKL